MELVRGLVGQAEVVYALMLRETRTRFGAHQLGYLWALLEPIILIATFWLLFHHAHRRAPAGMDLYSFIATGVVPYHLFANSLGRVANSVSGNKALLFYPRVQPLDLALARGALEAGTYAGVFIVLMTGHALYTETLEVHEPLWVIAGFAGAAVLGSGAGLVFCALAQMSRFVDRARGPLMRPLFWISGIFFVADQLPARARDALLANPVLHCTELVRAGWFPSYSAQYVDVGYVALWALSLWCVALTLERSVRGRIELT